MKQKLDIGRIGEKAAELELLKLGFDVINLNDFRNNFEILINFQIFYFNH